MIHSSQKQTATIYQFPTTQRADARRAEMRSRIEADMRATLGMAVGDSWYHAAAIREAELATKS